MAIVTMSTKELDRLRTLSELLERRIGVTEAAALMGVSRRQVSRLVKAFQSRGAVALVSRKRGRRSNRAFSPLVKGTILEIVRERYSDFGPTLAAEKLRELHGLPVATETLRLWMIADGIWLRRKDRKPRVHQPRHRRDCLGELIQIDGCQHWWFEDRGPKCTLLVFIDDATGRLMQLRFVPSESAFAYFLATRGYIEQHGKPIAFYSDKHTVFRNNNKDTVGESMTQ
jgi:transposase